MSHLAFEMVSKLEESNKTNLTTTLTTKGQPDAIIVDMSVDHYTPFCGGLKMAKTLTCEKMFDVFLAFCMPLKNPMSCGF